MGWMIGPAQVIEFAGFWPLEGNVTEAIMLAHGFPVPLLADLCIAGLATATVERMAAGGRKVEVVRIRITEAGRRALTGW
jgi:hypothetical protein